VVPKLQRLGELGDLGMKQMWIDTECPDIGDLLFLCLPVSWSDGWSLFLLLWQTAVIPMCSMLSYVVYKYCVTSPS
jgi:hypothetical protein